MKHLLRLFRYFWPRRSSALLRALQFFSSRALSTTSLCRGQFARERKLNAISAIGGSSCVAPVSAYQTTALNSFPASSSESNAKCCPTSQYRTKLFFPSNYDTSISSSSCPAGMPSARRTGAIAASPCLHRAACTL